MRDRDRLGGMQVILWTGLGLGAGLVAGFVLGEWIGGVSRLRVTGAARRLREPAPTRLTTSASARAVLAALQAEPRLAGIPVDAWLWPAAWSSCEAGCRPARRAPGRADGAGHARHRERHQQLAGARRGRRAAHPETRAPPTRAHDRAARPPIQSVRHRVRPLRLVAGARAVRAQRAGRALRGHDAAAQRHGGAPHGSRPQQYGAGRAGAVRADARPPGAVAPGHRPRGHRHPERGGASARQGGAHPIRRGPRSLRGAGVELRARDRRGHHRAAQGHRRIGRLEPDLLHPGRRSLPRRPGGLRHAVRRRTGLPGPLHHQLVSPLPHGPLERGSRKGRDRRQDLASPLPAGRRERAPDRRHHPARDDAGRHRGGRPPRGRALPPPGGRASCCCRS